MITERDMGYKAAMRELKKLSSASVKVGIQSDAGEHDEGGSIAEIAAVNEFGSPDGRIPPRPAHRNALDQNRDSLNTLIDRLVRGVADRKIDAKKAASILGETHQGNVQRSITDLRTPANAPLTIALKGGKSNPLIDTGQTLQSVRYKVEGL